MLDFLKWKEYKRKAEELEQELNDIYLTKEETKYLDLKIESEKLKTNIEILEDEYKGKQDRYEKKLLKTANLIVEYQKQVKDFEEILELQSFGLYNPRYDFGSSDAYKKELERVRNKQKTLIKEKKATVHSLDWTINGNKSEGKKFVLNIIKLSLRAFNNECDNLIDKVKYNNINKSEERIEKSYNDINNLTSSSNVVISSEYLNLKLEELYLKYEYECKKQEEKEEQLAIKERMKEEARVLKEIEDAMRKIEKEELHFKNAISNLNDRLKDIESEKEKEKVLVEIKVLEEKLSETMILKTDVQNREKNTRAGYVYIISNIGSFGEDVYKIGMTRRLEPEERVRELSNASVPFNFDIHAMIFSEDAPDLENKLHKHFANKQVNRVNHRKEFFKVSLNEIENVVKRVFDKPVEFTRTAIAEEYRKTRVIMEDKNEDRKTTNINEIKDIDDLDSFLENMGKYTNCLQIDSKIVDENEFEKYLNMFYDAKNLEKSKNTEDALKIYLEILDKYEPEGVSYFERPAIILEKQKKYEEALAITLKGKHMLKNKSQYQNHVDVNYFDKRISRLEVKIKNSKQ